MRDVYHRLRIALVNFDKTVERVVVDARGVGGYNSIFKGLTQPFGTASAVRQGVRQASTSQGDKK